MKLTVETIKRYRRLVMSEGMYGYIKYMSLLLLLSLYGYKRLNFRYAESYKKYTHDATSVTLFSNVCNLFLYGTHFIGRSKSIYLPNYRLFIKSFASPICCCKEKKRPLR